MNQLSKKDHHAWSFRSLVDSYAIQVWESEGGTFQRSNFSITVFEDLISGIRPVANDPVNNSSISRTPRFEEEFARIGYSQEELYFNKLNRELIDRKKTHKRTDPPH